MKVTEIWRYPVKTSSGSSYRCDQQNGAFFKGLEFVSNFTIKRGDAS